MNEPNHLDLFSGIGGFALAAQWAGFRTVGFCEIDKYCQKVLAKNFPDVPIIEDVFDLLCALKNNELLRSEILRLHGSKSHSGVLPSHANTAGTLSCSQEALLNNAEANDIAHGSAVSSPCVAAMGRTPVVDNGCVESATRTGKMVEGASKQYDQQNLFPNGAGASMPEIDIPAKPAASRPKDSTNSTRTTSKRGQNFQTSDLNSLMELLYADFVTRGRTVDLLTAGFPCQPFSVAGKRGGKDDDRHLWPALCEVIEGFRPTYLTLENVPGIIPMELDNVLSDLEGIGYATRAFVIPACAVDARHRRDRVWIVGRNMGNTDERRIRRAGTPWNEGHAPQPSESMAESSRELLNGHRRTRRRSTELADCSRWIAEPNMGRVAHGIPSRVDRLKGLGNAIVLQVAYEILREVRKLC